MFINSYCSYVLCDTKTFLPVHNVLSCIQTAFYATIAILLANNLLQQYWYIINNMALHEVLIPHK